MVAEHEWDLFHPGGDRTYKKVGRDIEVKFFGATGNVLRTEYYRLPEVRRVGPFAQAQPVGWSSDEQGVVVQTHFASSKLDARK